MAWFRKPRYTTVPAGQKKDIPEGLWTKCDKCQAVTFNAELERNWRVCPKCGYHFPLGAWDRIRLLVDRGAFHEIDSQLRPSDPLRFEAQERYADKLAAAQERTGLADAVVTGEGAIDGVPVVLAVMDFSFIGASMGSVVGEKVARAAERALSQRRPLIAVACSGGARMHEGILSLMQMAKTASAVSRLGEAGVPFIVIITHPTMGGVTASFASLGDVIIAEPGAMLGFAGRRVINQTVREELPEGFQTAEFMREHGMVDMVVPRKELRPVLARVLRMLMGLPTSPLASGELEEQPPGAAEPQGAADESGGGPAEGEPGLTGQAAAPIIPSADGEKGEGEAGLQGG